MKPFCRVAVGFVVLALATAACGGGGSQPAPAGDASAGAGTNNSASADKNAYPVFPNADAGADPAVPADQGGKGFKGEGWETNTDYDLIGDPRAVKGGVFKEARFTDFPTTLRYVGPNVSEWNQMLHTMVYETLLGLHPTSLAYIPALATHWQIAADKRSFRFRIDPNARFSDGQPVTSADVIASWKLVVDKTVQDPARYQVFSNFETPVAESKYIVSVKAKTENWQNFLYFSNNLFVYPASILKGMTGDTYIREYNYKMLPGTGPYMVSEQDVAKGQSIKIRRRKDYWGEKQRRNVGVSNFDEINQVVVRDRNLEFEMFKKGDLDFYFVQRAQMWAQELEFPNIKRGLIQKRRVYNNNPQGLQGLSFNTRREPLDDIRVRKALRHLFNRELMVEKMMFGQYEMMNSIFAGSMYENPNNEKIRYDPQKALQLLAEAGWKDRDANGRLTRNGRTMNLEVIYADQPSERYFTIYQEDLRKVGITLNLRFITFETMVKLLDERTFMMAGGAYTGEVFPMPEMTWLSRLADEKNTNNITGFKNARADEIIGIYAKTFDLQTRVKLLQELDGIITNNHDWIMEWTAPYERLVYWNKFGQPQGYITRTNDRRDVASLWWADGDRARKLDEAMRDPSIQLGEGPSDDKYWVEYGTTRGFAGADSEVTAYFIRRLLLVIPTFIGITMVVFVVMHFVPGGPIERQIIKYKMAMAGEGGAGGGGASFRTEIPPEALEELKRFYGFDKPVHVRYAIWLWHVVRLDLGTSYVYQDPVWDVIKSRFPISIFLGLTGFILSYLVCVPLGVLKAVHHGSKFDFISSVIVFLGYSVPGWALGTALLVLFGGGSFFNVFPLGGFRPDNWEYLSLWGKVTGQVSHMFLPVLCYMVGSFATETILTKNSLMENLGQDYVRTAFAKGLPERRVIFVHALRNSLIPLVTGFGSVFGLILAGSFLIERVFNIDGMGYLGYQAILQRDYPVALGILVISSLLMLLGNILSDVIYAVVDPRIRFS